MQEAERKAAVDQVIEAIEQAEALGIEVFRSFDSAVISRGPHGYNSRL